MGRDLPKLGAEPEPKGIKGPSVRPQKIQIALSIYHSILAQAALRTARLSTLHTPSHKSIQIQHFARTTRQGIVVSSTGTLSRHHARLHTLCTHTRHNPGPPLRCHHYRNRARKRRRSALSWRRSGRRLSHLYLALCSRRAWTHSPACTTPRGPHDTRGQTIMNAS